MAVAEPDVEVRELAHRVLSTLMTGREVQQHRVAVLVERRRVGAPWTELVVAESADLFEVSLGYPGSFRACWVDIDRGGHRTESLAWAAAVIADVFQDEVIELLRAARPGCHNHAHPMSIRSEGGRTSWQCPADPGTQRPVWP